MTLGLAVHPAAAAPVTEIFSIAASGFGDVIGATTPPADPVSLAAGHVGGVQRTLGHRVEIVARADRADHELAMGALMNEPSAWCEDCEADGRVAF